MRFQRIAGDNIDRTIEQPCNIFFQVDIIEHRNMGLWLGVDHDIEIAFGTVIATCNRPENGNVPHAARPQVVFVAPQSCKGVFDFHALYIALRHNRGRLPSAHASHPAAVRPFGGRGAVVGLGGSGDAAGSPGARGIVPVLAGSAFWLGGTEAELSG
jgi:hypothetical protein